MPPECPQTGPWTAPGRPLNGVWMASEWRLCSQTDDRGFSGTSFHRLYGNDHNIHQLDSNSANTLPWLLSSQDVGAFKIYERFLHANKLYLYFFFPLAGAAACDSSGFWARQDPSRSLIWDYTDPEGHIWKNGSSGSSRSGSKPNTGPQNSHDAVHHSILLHSVTQEDANPSVTAESVPQGHTRGPKCRTGFYLARSLHGAYFYSVIPFIVSNWTSSINFTVWDFKSWKYIWFINLRRIRGGVTAAERGNRAARVG